MDIELDDVLQLLEDKHDKHPDRKPAAQSPMQQSGRTNPSGGSKSPPRQAERVALIMKVFIMIYIVNQELGQQLWSIAPAVMKLVIRCCCDGDCSCNSSPMWASFTCTKHKFDAKNITK